MEDILTCNDQELAKYFMANLENVLSELPPAIVEYKHIFAPGVYIRKMYAAAGSVITSKVHKTEHVFILSKGSVFVYDGVHEGVILRAPYDGLTMPGTKRMGIVLEDCIWMNVHPTKIHPKNNSEDELKNALDKIERKVVEPYKNLKLN